MKTVGQRITHPLICNAILLPLALLLAFNFFMRQYMIANARNNLRTTTTIVVSLIHERRNSGEGISGSNNLTPALKQQLDQVRSIVRATSQINSLDILIISQNGRLLYPLPAVINLPAARLARLGVLVSREQDPSQITVFRSLTGAYLFSKTLLMENLPGKSPWIVCLTEYNPIRGPLLTINLMLLAILATGSLISVIVSLRTARRIRDPLNNLVHMAEQIGKGDYRTISPDAFCSEITRLQTSLNVMIKRLSRSDHLQKTFIQDASHELRTPLMIIQGYAEGLQQGVLSDAPSVATVILKETQKLSQLVESLLTLSRIENQAEQPEQTKINLHDWLLDQVQSVDTLARREGKQVTCRCDPAVTLLVNEMLLEQALRNILGNAVRYAAEMVDVTAGSDGHQAWIRIADDGPGIDAADLPYIFDRFYKGRSGQTGLGLAITRSAVAALGGQISAENRSRGGAEFLLRLPLRKNG